MLFDDFERRLEEGKKRKRERNPLLPLGRWHVPHLVFSH